MKKPEEFKSADAWDVFKGVLVLAALFFSVAALVWTFAVILGAQ